MNQKTEKETKSEEREIWNPRYGLGDVHVKGDGIADFAYGSNYLDVTIDFLDEETFEIGAGLKFGELHLTTNEEALIEKGLSAEEAKELSEAVTVITKYIKIVNSNPEYELHEKESPYYP